MIKSEQNGRVSRLIRLSLAVESCCGVCGFRQNPLCEPGVRETKRIRKRVRGDRNVSVVGIIRVYRINKSGWTQTWLSCKGALFLIK